MTDLSTVGAIAPPLNLLPSRPVSSGGWTAGEDPGELERQRLIARARDTDAALQLQRCLGGWAAAVDELAWRALVRLAANQSVDPNDRDSWRSADGCMRALLERHGLTSREIGRLRLDVIDSLCARQAQADRDAGLDWSSVTAPASRLDERLARARIGAPMDLSDPALYTHLGDQRRVLAQRLRLPAAQADELSRWTVEQAGQFDAEDLRSWRIGSDTWLGLADKQLEPVGKVSRPVGLFVVPALSGAGWQLSPVLALEMIRLAAELGGWVERDLAAAWIPAGAADQLIERVNLQTLHAGPKDNVDHVGDLARALARELGRPVSPARPETSATGGDDCWCPANPTPARAAGRSPSFDCGW